MVLSKISRLGAAISIAVTAVLYQKGYLSTTTASASLEAQHAIADLVYNNGPWARNLHDLPVWDLIESGFIYTSAAGVAGTKSLEDCSRVDQDDYDNSLYFAIRAISRKSLGENSGSQHVRLRRVLGVHRRLHRAVGSTYLLMVDADLGDGMAGTHQVAVHHGLDGSGAVRIRLLSDNLEFEGFHLVVDVKSDSDVKLLPDMVRDVATASDPNHRVIGISFVCHHGTDIRPEMEEMHTLAQGIPLSIYTATPSVDPLVAVARGLGKAHVLVIITPATIVRQPFLTRCQANTVQGAQVYVPIPYALYPGGEDIGWHRGAWRTDQYSIICINARDVLSIAARSGSHHEGLADLALRNRYSIFRAFEPAVLVKWQDNECTSSESPCTAEFLKTLGSQKRLAEILRDRRRDVSNTVMTNKSISGV